MGSDNNLYSLEQISEALELQGLDGAQKDAFLQRLGAIASEQVSAEKLEGAYTAIVGYVSYFNYWKDEQRGMDEIAFLAGDLVNASHGVITDMELHNDISTVALATSYAMDCWFDWDPFLPDFSDKLTVEESVVLDVLRESVAKNHYGFETGMNEDDKLQWADEYLREKEDFIELITNDLLVGAISPHVDRMSEYVTTRGHQIPDFKNR